MKTVVTVKIGEKAENLFKHQGLPSDLWSWRKYGQKPIKGSPYPRGYYRCSTCKGCSAKKQIERCRTDASLLIITYSNTHNHPDPDSKPISPKEPNSYKPIVSPAREAGESAENGNDRLQFLHASDKEGAPLGVALDDRCLDEEPVRSDPTSISAVGTEKENDFFDELEELPMSSGFTRLAQNDDVSNGRIPAVPS